ncbi:hypothetical protein [Aquimarina macrocephali]|uniref:hypothetical protein n=1 Tax=Aquimarina macrocephali TaxID=666563 RepID=UPI000465C2D3|nr:hypothetical protein [Aquimarina macrocephali]
MKSNEKKKLEIRIYFTGIITLLVGTHLIWDYYHEGVPTHHILHREDLPGISNWWGVIVLPLLTWYLLYRIHQRLVNKERLGLPQNMTRIIYRFIGALSFGILISFFFTIGSDFPGYMMIGLCLVSFFVPLYRSEHLLGFVIGMTYTFGVILPTGIGVLLTIIFIITYKIVRTGMLYLISKK